MTKYYINGSMVRLGNDLDTQVENNLPVGVYTVGFSIEMGYFLTRSPEFTLPSKLYGDTDKMSDRILSTFADRSGTTGVLLSGVKGSGKSLLMKHTAQKALAKGLPVLIVNSAFSGDGFNKFIQAVDHDCVVIFDEFEKVYAEQEQQEQLLTLFDGVYSSKKLFILTANDRYKINNYMNNRPGRIYYSINYTGLSAEFIVEFCNDVLENKKYVDQIVLFASLFQDFNFDMLKALCEELNRYGETLKEALHVLNIKQESDRIIYDMVEWSYKGEKIKVEWTDFRRIMNPFSGTPINFGGYRSVDEDGEFEEDTYVEAVLDSFAKTTLRSEDLNRIEYNPTPDLRVVFERPKVEEPAYYRLMI